MMIFINFVGGLRKLNSIQNDVFYVLESQGHYQSDSGSIQGDSFFIIFHQNFDPKKLTFGYWEHQFYANSGGFEARILKFMIFSSAVFKGFKF